MDGDRCRQPNCDGVIDGGFCNRCGLEPADLHTVAGTSSTAAYASAPASGGSAVSGSSASARTGSRSSRRGSSTRGSSRKNLGLGLVTVPELPPLAPELAIMADPKVPENRRFCSNPNCADDKGNPTTLRRESGHCPQCGKRYSFVPSLKPGDLVAEQYQVKGCLAFGGLGWVYLAQDTTLNRWVVLKGLLNTEDEGAAAAAVAERQFLAAVKHPNIVGIYNFVKHGNEGFIVMEFVAGTSVKELRKKRGPLPPAEAIAYIHRILGSFAYLHRQGMVYCDFKPENFMIEGDPADVKLIDMGGVRRLDDEFGDIYGTKGYSAPEVGEGPTVVTDLYTVGRSLAVLLMDFSYQGRHEFSLPSPQEQSVLAQYEALYLFLLRATHRDPDRRFQSADEMADQLGGVLREIVAGSVTPRPFESNLFGADVSALLDDEETALRGPSADLLPEVKTNPEDPAANFLATTASVNHPSRRATLLTEARAKYSESVELALRLAQALIAIGEFSRAEEVLAEVEAKDPFDWRVPWYRGAKLLKEGKAKEAWVAFDQVYSELPGELAVKLAVALAAEAAGDRAVAARLYDRVSRTDAGFTAASFGLARCQAATGKRAEAVEAYARVPATSSLYTKAQTSLARTLIRAGSVMPALEEVQKAAAVIEALALEGMEQAQLRAEVLETSLGVLERTTVAVDRDARLLGEPMHEWALRRGLEQALRQMARLENDREKQIALVDRANEVRPRTWI